MSIYSLCSVIPPDRFATPCSRLNAVLTDAKPKTKSRRENRKTNKKSKRAQILKFKKKKRIKPLPKIKQENLQGENMSTTQYIDIGEIVIGFEESKKITENIALPWHKVGQHKEKKSVAQMRAEILAQQLAESTNSSFSIKAFI